MCVGLSAKVVRISDGTAVVVHAGIAIAKITDEDDSETEQLMEELL